jgi:hypothetical protein
MFVRVEVEPGAAMPLANTATVSGGSAPEASTDTENAITSAPPAFGIANFSTHIAGVDGAGDTQAAGHPYELTTRIDLATELRITAQGSFGPTGVEDPKDIVVDLPLGFLGSARAAPQCTLAQLSSGTVATEQNCPPDTQVGHIRSEPSGSASVDSPIYNLIPERGAAAEFGYLDALNGSHVLYARVVPSRAGYIVQVTSSDIPQIQLQDVTVTFFGDPAAKDGNGNTPVALFTNPAQCSGQSLVTTAYMDSWQQPGRFNADGTPDLSDPRWVSVTAQSPPVTGCNQLEFTPTLSVQPETSVADSPTGLHFGLEVPQTEDPGALATPPLENATIQLPPGLTVDPSSAHGLGACSPTQIGWLGDTPTDFTSDPPACPAASKIGTVEVTTPLLPNPLTGAVYLATQNENPFHSLLAGYLVVDDPPTGVVIKIPGNFTLDANTGQITGVFDDNPQLPFSKLRVQFKGGTTGALATPEGCGVFTTIATLMPWSAPDSGPPASPSDSFATSAGCVNGFAPTFTALTTSPVAGAFSPFTLSFSRSDTDQGISGLTVTLPPGLLADIANTALCPEPALVHARSNSAVAEASTPSCPAASQVGTVQAGVGPGPNPFFVPGRIYLTGPYKQGPYGLAVVVPAIAGPFDLGTVVVRQAIEIDPHDAHVTVTSDPFPTIIDGIPLRLRRVDATVDRPSFTFNPTNCTPTAIAGRLTSVDGFAAAVASRFQAGECGRLSFKPSFTVFTQSKTSKANGASLHVKVAYPKAPFGSRANIGKVKVDLPKQLPSRLTTLQKACTAAVFEANPAACPPGSVVGQGTAVTPVLKNPLTGPAYLVSHGGEAFPDLVIVLQGEGITLDLVGNTDIKKGITSSTFNAVPDAPISTFDLVLPVGPHSVFAAYLPVKAKGSMCGQSLSMPTAITGQNGAQVTQSTKIAVTGCKAVTISNRKLSGKNVVLSFFLTAKGTVTVTGNGLKKYRKTLGAGAHQIKVALSQAGLSLRTRRRKIKIKVALRSGAKVSTATTTLKL